MDERFITFTGGEQVFEISSNPEVDQETINAVADIPADVLLEIVRQRLAKYPENKVSTGVVALRVRA
jgi:hypothetical protein